MSKQLTKEEQVKEMFRCKQDFIYFVEHYTYVDVGAGYQTLKLADKQKELARSFINDHNVLVLGSRQTGKTTLMICYCAWAMLFFPAISITFISRKEDQAKKQMTDLAILFEKLPDFMRPTLNPDQATIKTIVENGSTISIESVLTNPEGKGRGMRSHIVWIDEAAFLKTLDPLLAALLPTTAQRFLMAKKKGLPYGIIMTTTPNGVKGVGKVFHELWTEANKAKKEKEENKEAKITSFFSPFKIHWSDLPFYNDEWYEEEKKKFGKARIRKFHQEYDLLFLGTESTFFPDELLVKFESSPSIKRYDKLWIFEEYDPNKKYIIATDVATAFGSCNSAIQVINSETLEQVAEFIDKLPIGPPAPYNLVGMIKKVSALYPTAIISFEHNGVGNDLVEKLPYIPEIKDKLYYEPNKKKPGFNTTGASREALFDMLASIITENPFLVKSSRTISELIALVVDKNGKAVKGKNETDDSILALGQAYMISSRLELMKGVGTGSISQEITESMSSIQNILNFNIKKKFNSANVNNTQQDLNGPFYSLDRFSDLVDKLS